MKCKVVFVTDTLLSGGAERVISVVANSLSLEYQVEIICLRNKDVFYEIAPSIRVLSLPDCSWVKKFILLRKVLAESHTNVVIAFMRNVYEFTMMASLGLGLSIVPCERVDPKIAPFFSKIIRGLLLPFASKFVVQTDEMKDYFRKSIQKKTIVIANPVDDSFLREPVAFEDRDDIIVSVGRLAPQKDFKTLIRAFSFISDQFPSYSLVIYGEGPQRDELQSYIKSMGLEERVKLPGRSNEIYKELSKSKVFAQTSLFEGMSNAVIEAVCSGLPIVTTAVSGAKQIVKENVNGFIVGVGKDGEVANRIEQLISNISLLKRFSEASYNMRDLYRIESVSEEWKILINEVNNYE